MATIKDVARLAGVGVGTASRVVSGKGSVAQATVEKVRKAIAELDFRPSHAARALFSGCSQMIGVYMPYRNGTFFAPILQKIYAELQAANLNMVVSFGAGGGDARRQTIEGIEFLMARGCDGILLISSTLLDSDIEALGPIRSRLVALNHAFTTIPDQCLTVDHVFAGRLAARTLLSYGHREIAVIAGPSSVPDNVDRIKGFLAELNEAGIDTGQMWVAESNFASEGGWAAAKELLASDYPFTAVFCANDEMAVGALSYFHGAGVDVPGAVSVHGYDDVEGARFTVPRLSSVHIPWYEMTESGLNLLLNRCYGLARPVVSEFRINVTMRASVAAARSPLPRRESGRA